MKRFTFKKKLIAGAAAAALVVGLSGAAYSYWTSTGSGTGSASTGTSASTLSVVGTATTALTVGNSSPVTFTAGNSSSFAQEISTISLTNVKAYDTQADATLNDGSTGLISGCGMTTNLKAADTSTATSGEPDFWMADVTPATLADGHIGAGQTAQVMTTQGTLNMNDLTNQNQQACKGVFLALTFAVS
jgi:hypothetical protein